MVPTLEIGHSLANEALIAAANLNLSDAILIEDLTKISEKEINNYTNLSIDHEMTKTKSIQNETEDTVKLNNNTVKEQKNKKEVGDSTSVDIGQNLAAQELEKSKEIESSKAIAHGKHSPTAHKLGSEEKGSKNVYHNDEPSGTGEKELNETIRPVIKKKTTPKRIRKPKKTTKKRRKIKLTTLLPKGDKRLYRTTEADTVTESATVMSTTINPTEDFIEKEENGGQQKNTENLYEPLLLTTKLAPPQASIHLFIVFTCLVLILLL